MKRLLAKDRIFVAMMVAVSVVLVGSALANEFEPILPTDPSNPQFFDPQIDVDPSDMLTDGQVVAVDGKVFGADQTGFLRQCNEDLSVCSSTSTPFTTGRNGNFGPFGNPDEPNDPASVPVNFTVHTTFTAEGSGMVVSCLPSSCVLVAFSDQGSEIRAACHHLTFGTTDTTPCVLPPSATSTSTSSTSTSSTSTSSTSTTSTTLAPTTTTTSTTLAPTTTTTTSTTLAPTTTTTSTTLAPGTTTTTVIDRCGALEQFRSRLNEEIGRLESALRQALSGSVLDQVLAVIEQVRAQANAQLDQLLASCSQPAT